MSWCIQTHISSSHASSFIKLITPFPEFQDPIIIVILNNENKKSAKSSLSHLLSTKRATMQNMSNKKSPAAGTGGLPADRKLPAGGDSLLYHGRRGRAALSCIIPGCAALRNELLPSSRRSQKAPRADAAMIFQRQWKMTWERIQIAQRREREDRSADKIYLGLGNLVRAGGWAERCEEIFRRGGGGLAKMPLPCCWLL